jgi:signal transduction histidine kinase
MWKTITLLVAACCSCVLSNPAQAKPIKNILVLHEGWEKMPTNALFNEQLQEAFSRDGSFDVQLFQEYVDARLGQSLSETADFLRRKYAKQNLDLIVAGGFRAFNLLLSEDERTFPGVPAVFISYGDFDKVKDRLPKNITGVTAQLDIAGTVRLARQLQPDTRNLFVVYGSSQYERAEMPLVLAQLPSIAGQLNVSYLSEMTLEETLTRVSSLPDHSVILFFTFLTDASGHVYVPTQVCTLVSTYANAPVYSFPQVDLGRGTMGGSIFNIEKSTQEVAQMALSILKGADVQDVPVRRGPPNEVTLDWRQLQRWHIPESRIPKNAVVLFREPGIWERYRLYIFGAVAIVMLQSLLIAALVVEARRRKEAERTIKWTQQELEELSGRLIHAQEEERKRVARELHDNFGQRLTVLSLELAQHLAVPQTAEQLSDCLRDLSDKLKDVARAMNVAALQLHTAHLEVLGLVSALEGLCDEFSRQYGIETSFVHSGVLARVPSDLTLCLFRVVQEGLQNVAKHSRALTCEVTLTGTSEGIHLSIKDSGLGFDTARLKLKPGLGFVSMRERLRLVGGELTVESKLSQGTRLGVRVPIATERSRAVGQ